MKSVISIIIPTYNRAHLIGETLDSVMAQTYQNWECIVVDDGSTDDTEKVMEAYMAKDSRIQYHHRPPEHQPGGNGARNYGFKMSRGEYVNWFDSDDVMHEEKLATQLEAIIENQLDFHISAFQDFTEDKVVSDYKHQRNKNEELNLINFITSKIFFGTVDFIGTRKSIGNIVFDEQYNTGQEFSFFCQYLSNGNKGIYLDEVLTYRRVHQYSLENIQKENIKMLNENKFRENFHTYLLLENKLELAEKKFLINKSAIYFLSTFRNPEFHAYKKTFLRAIRTVFDKRRMLFYKLLLLSLEISDRGKYRYKNMIKTLFI